MKQLFFLFMLFIANAALSQEFEWVSSFGSSSSEMVNDILVDDDGNAYVCGSFRFTVDFDSGPNVEELTSAGSADGCIIKYNALGQFQWVKQIASSGANSVNQLAIDQLGNIVAVGAFTNTVDFNPGAPVFNLTSNGATDVFIWKLNSAGEFISASSFGGTDNDFVTEFKLDGNYDMILAGTFGAIVDFDPGPGSNNIASGQGTFSSDYILKLDDNLAFQWVLNTNTRFITISDLTTDISNNIYICGSYTGIIDFDPSPATLNLSSLGGSDGFVLKLNSNGQFTWAKSMGGPNSDNAYSLDVDNNQDLIVSGVFTDNITFGNLGTLNSSGESLMFITKMNTSGSFLWVKGLQGSPNEISLDENNSIFVTGYSNSEGDFDPSPLTYSANYYGGDDILIARFDSLGNLNWAKTIGGSFTDRGSCIFLGSNSDIFIGGLFSETVSFNQNNPSNTSISNGDSDAFLLKLSLCSIPSNAGFISGPTSICSSVQANYTIDPVNGADTYTWSKLGNQPFVLDSIEASLETSFLATGNYQIYVTPINTCGQGSSSVISITNLPRPFVNASLVPPVPICLGSSVLLDVTGSNNGTFVWENGVSPGPQTPAETTTFVVEITGTNGCTNTDSITVVVSPIPVLAFELFPSDTICTGSSLSINVSGADSYTFPSGISNNVPFFPTASTTYNIQGANNGCEGSVIVPIVVNQTPEIILEPISETVIQGLQVQFNIISSPSNANFIWEINTENGFEQIVNTGIYSGMNSPELIIFPAGLDLDGSEYRCITSLGECSDTSQIAVLNVSTSVGFQNFDNNIIQVQPSLAHNSIKIKGIEPSNSTSAEIVDSQGRLIKTISKEEFLHSIDISTLTIGWYSIHINDRPLKPLRFFKQY
ncbi:MAG: hypothetical protein WED33_00380 [Bacteroidia bacterium]